MNKHTKILAAILLCLFTAYNLFGLNGLTVIFWAIALCVGYALLFASMRIWQKRKIRKYKIISCPGCYPTSILLPLIPLIKNNLINSNNIIIDSKSGLSLRN